MLFLHEYKECDHKNRCTHSQLGVLKVMFSFFTSELVCARVQGPLTRVRGPLLGSIQLGPMDPVPSSRPGRGRVEAGSRPGRGRVRGPIPKRDHAYTRVPAGLSSGEEQCGLGGFPLLMVLYSYASDTNASIVASTSSHGIPQDCAAQSTLASPSWT